MARHSPLDGEHRSAGAKMVDFGGWEMPLSYPTGTLVEHQACRNDAAVFDVSHLGTIRVTGPDAFERLQLTLTNDLSRISVGRAQYSHLLAQDGSVIDDLITWWVDNERFDVIPNAANTAPALTALQGVDVTQERAVLAVQGPMAKQRLATVLPELASLERNHVCRLQFGGRELVAAGTGYTGEAGVELAVAAEVAVRLWTTIVDTGVLPAGLGARDTLRLEAGLPLHGHELGAGITPLQAGMSWAVAFDKGPFVGRDALVEEKARGVTRRLRGFRSHSRQPLRENSPVVMEDRAVGALTSGNYSPILGRGIGLGFVEAEVKVGTTVTIDLRGRSVEATVVKPPFVSPAARP